MNLPSTPTRATRIIVSAVVTGVFALFYMCIGTTAFAAPMDRSISIGILFGEEYCTFWWLLLLVMISLGWSVYDDLIQHTEREYRDLFVYPAIFSGLYAVTLVFAQMIGILENVWWIFAATWIAMTALDYQAHRNLIFPWSPKLRNKAYGGASAAVILSTFIFNFPCVWWPFFLVLVTGILLLLFDAVDEGYL